MDRSLKWQGANNPRWNNGICINDAGYILVRSKDHPSADIRGYVRQHRLVMEAVIGRYLTPQEDVHHLDGDKRNNDSSNLILCATRSDHLKRFHPDGGSKTWFKKGQKSWNKISKPYPCLNCNIEVWRTERDLKLRKYIFCSLPCYWTLKRKGLYAK